MFLLGGVNPYPVLSATHVGRIHVAIPFVYAGEWCAFVKVYFFLLLSPSKGERESLQRMCLGNTTRPPIPSHKRENDHVRVELVRSELFSTEIHFIRPCLPPFILYFTYASSSFFSPPLSSPPLAHLFGSLPFPALLLIQAQCWCSTWLTTSV